MTHQADPAGTTPRLRDRALRIGVAALASFALGFLTSYAQGLLPDALASFANSASGWTLLTALLVFWARQTWPVSALLGAASFVLLTVGYAVAASARGMYYDPAMFAVIGLLVGPVVGVATAWLRERGVRAALGTSVLAGIGVGEAVYGLTIVGDTTSPVYWTIIGVLALALLGWSLARRIRGRLAIACAVIGTVAVAVAFYAAYGALGGA